MTPGTAQWIMAYQLSPIVLFHGIAEGIQGGGLPIISITEAQNYPSGLTGPGGALDLDDYFANFAPLPGGTLGENQIGNYPFANQTVAANAIIAQPLLISMLMICPARQTGGYATALSKMTALQSALAQHDSLGGTYGVATPKFLYTNLIRLRLVDVSTAQSHQAQNTYQWDFIKPLLTLEEAQAAQNSLMSKLSSGSQIQGQPSYSGGAASVGQPSSLAGTSIPAGAPLAGMNTAPVGAVTGEYSDPIGQTVAGLYNTAAPGGSPP
jgi:hypothetical protein